METLTNIPFSLDAGQIMTQAHVKVESAYAAELLSLIELAQEIGNPKAGYTVSFITGRDGDKIQIEDVWFKSKALVHNLESAERVFPFVASCGRELDQAFPDKGNMLKEFWWDMIKSHLLGAAYIHLSDHLHRRFRLGKTATMRPGSGDASVWPIEQQKDLFSLLGNVESEVGVQLTESFLMVPNMTISAFLFPTETDCQSCGVCHKEKCPSRHAPVKKELWDQIQQE